MGFFDIVLYISVALLYNLLIHSLASISYRDLPYNEKLANSTIMLILFGGIGILISKLIDERNKELKNSFVSKGLYFGGILLIVTAIFANWDKITEEIKLFTIAGLLGGIIWYGYNKNKQELKRKEIEGKLNEKIINDLVKD
ncbi:hypothetical protein Indivirus_1_166 [Indivirus ILV1]|uniref:Uncharacterized protein n=1 Tax=Indivirus ILV1 TaxID=1977633 RepID=A0A1V0SCU8_9VIRU|nr:hypothetical protein Indivirus_1_166 [Indivirus ILV1]